MTVDPTFAILTRELMPDKTRISSSSDRSSRHHLQTAGPARNTFCRAMSMRAWEW
jgi:hypothetical protein